MAYADYDYYVNTYRGGIVTADKFDCFAERASDFMDTVTFDRLKNQDYSEYQDKIQKCCCALAENLNKYDTGNFDKTSETIGEYSVSFNHKSESDIKKSMHSIVSEYLGNTGLMYRGID